MAIYLPRATRKRLLRLQPPVVREAAYRARLLQLGVRLGRSGLDLARGLSRRVGEVLRLGADALCFARQPGARHRCGIRRGERRVLRNRRLVHRRSLHLRRRYLLVSNRCPIADLRGREGARLVRKEATRTLS